MSACAASTVGPTVVEVPIRFVDREEGGSDALARLGVRLNSLFHAKELLELHKTPGKRHG